jgi:hypothetical protein
MNEPHSPPLTQRAWFWLALTVLAGAIVGYEVYRSGRNAIVKDDTFRAERYMVPQPVMEEFAVKPVGDVGDELTANELVLGVTVGKEARAYPLNMLNAEPKTKVLNDVLAGRAIAVSWCDKCLTGIVFDRAVAGQTLTFGVFGSLWRESMVLYDRETMTQWSQWEGTAKLGPLQGARLEPLPSVVAVWQDWRRQYPEGSVVLLERRQSEFTSATYANAASHMFVAGQGADAKAWNLTEIADQRVINDRWLNKPVVLFFLETSGTARLFERCLGEQELTLRWDQGVIVDEPTGSTWDALTGRAIAGPMRGRQLLPLAGAVTTRAAWKQFHQ